MFGLQSLYDNTTLGLQSLYDNFKKGAGIYQDSIKKGDPDFLGDFGKDYMDSITEGSPFYYFFKGLETGDPLTLDNIKKDYQKGKQEMGIESIPFFALPHWLIDRVLDPKDKKPEVTTEPLPKDESKSKSKGTASMTTDQLQSGGKLPKETKNLNMFQKVIKGLADNPDFALSLGKSLLEGKGLGLGLIEGAEAQTKADTAKASAALSKRMAEAKIAGEVPDDIQIAQIEALASGAMPGTKEYDLAIIRSLREQRAADASKNDYKFQDLVKAAMYSGEDLKDTAKKVYDDMIKNVGIGSSGEEIKSAYPEIYAN